MQVWDTAGQERYHALGPICSRAMHCVVAVYNTTNRHSFDRLIFWVSNIPSQGHKPFILGKPARQPRLHRDLDTGWRSHTLVCGGGAKSGGGHPCKREGEATGLAG